MPPETFKLLDVMVASETIMSLYKSWEPVHVISPGEKVSIDGVEGLRHHHPGLTGRPLNLMASVLMRQERRHRCTEEKTTWTRRQRWEGRDHVPERQGTPTAA